MIDLRSDTVTRPTPAMREAIARAEVGDDVFRDDPTVMKLEARTAEIVGKEAALFVPTGSMGNQLALAVLTRPGEDVIVGDGAHVMFYEAGAAGALNGVQLSPAGRGGLFTADEMEERIHLHANMQEPTTTLVCVENTHNRSGGRVFPQKDVVAIAERARSRGFSLHLDGARLWNASAATGLSPAELSAPFDTVNVCYSKGLGAPIGSAICGSRELVERARRVRKRWGGAMRQIGMMAAGALHALEHHRDRLKDDHANAKRFAEAIAKAKGFRVDLASVETNIVNVDVDVPADPVVAKAKTLGLLLGASGPKRIRVVTHLDVTSAQVLEAATLLAKAIEPS